MGVVWKKQGKGAQRVYVRTDAAARRSPAGPARIEPDGSLYKRTSGGAAQRGWYPTLQDAKAGRGGRSVWRQFRRGRRGPGSPVMWLRVDGWEVRHGSGRGAKGCWSVYRPDGSLFLPAGKGRREHPGVFGSALAARRAAPPLSGEMSGGGSSKARRTRPDRASRAAERSRSRSASTGRRPPGGVLDMLRELARREAGPGAKVPITINRLRMTAYAAGWSPAQFEIALRNLYNAKLVNLYAEDNPAWVTIEMKAGGMRLGTDQVHWVRDTS